MATIEIAIDVSLVIACVGAAVGPTVINEREALDSVRMLTGLGYK